MYIIYNILLFVLYPLILFAALFNKEIKKNLAIRRNFNYRQFDQIQKKNIYWLHASSVGEYQQAEVLAVALRNKYSNAFIVMSAYSYSAFKQKKDENEADLFFILPFDFYFSMKRLVQKISPQAMFFIKYDVWPNLVYHLKKKNIRCALLCAALPEKSKRLKGIGGSFLKKVYKKLNIITTISSDDSTRFYQRGIKAFTCGDTRFESILNRVNKEDKDTIEKITQYLDPNKKVLIGGSTYPTSEKFLIDFITCSPPPSLQAAKIQLILAPHHINDEHISSIEKLLRTNNISFALFSQGNPTKKVDVIIIDAMGLLQTIYKVADFAYVGGGWQGSIHTVIEPSIFGIPMICGPSINNATEALELKSLELLTVMQTPSHNEIENFISSFQDEAHYNNTKKKLQNYFASKLEASQKIIKLLEEKSLL